MKTKGSLIMNKYQEQALDFLKECDAKIRINFIGFKANRDWNETKERSLFNIVLTTPKGFMNFNFWDSFVNTTKLRNQIRVGIKITAKPTIYDVLACLTKYDPGTFEDFCSDYGYDEDSETSKKIYFAVQDEFSQLCEIFTPEQMEKLCEIQ